MLSIENYSDKSFVIRGDTRDVKEELKRLGGKYNSRLRGGPGWIFPKSKRDEVVEFAGDDLEEIDVVEMPAAKACAKAVAKACAKACAEREALLDGAKPVAAASSNGTDVLLRQLISKIDALDAKISHLAKPTRQQATGADDSDDGKPLPRLRRKK